MYKHLIFDLDDTLLDFTKGEEIGLENVLTAHGMTDLASAVAVYKTINQQVWRDIEQGANRDMLLNSRFARLFAEFGHAVDGAALEREYRHFLDTNYHVIDGAPELMAHLRQLGYHIIAGTNGVAATQAQRLANSNMAQFFDEVFTSEGIGVAKPAVGFYDAIFTALPGMAKADTVMIGDGLSSDIQGAANYGIDSIWVNLRNQTNTTTLPMTAEVTNLQDLSTLLSR